MGSSDKSKNISRRKFIEISLQGSAGIGLGQALSIPLVASYGCSPENAKTVHGACYHDCPDTCRWTVTAVTHKITKFEANAGNPYTAGKLCSKMDNFPNYVTFNPDRVLTPLKRIGKKGTGEFGELLSEIQELPKAHWAEFQLVAHVIDEITSGECRRQ